MSGCSTRSCGSAASCSCPRSCAASLISMTNCRSPMAVARLLQAVMVEPKDTALVVGAGVGYEAALLSLLARSVVALEDNAELARIGRSALVDHRIASVGYVEGPLHLGYRQRSPYDVILFGGAVAEIPPEI